jgi:shikimate dehydrogenase
VLGAGGAARGAVAALSLAGATDIRVLNRTVERAEAIAALLPCKAYGWKDATAAFEGASTLINATSGQLEGSSDLPMPDSATVKDAVAMDMVYTPLMTPFLVAAGQRGFHPVDGLDMLIGQAIPSFAAMFNRAAPTDLDVRALLLDALNARSGDQMR